MIPIRSLLPALACALALLAPSAPAGTHTSDRGTIYLPDGIAPREVVPVVVVEGGLAASHGRVWQALSSERRVIVVETRSLREALQRPNALMEVRRGIHDALRFGAEHHDLTRCPWVLVAFSVAAPQFGWVALTDPGRFQGLAFVNAAVQRNELPPEPGAAKGTRVAVIASNRDPVVPLVRAEALRGWLDEAGLDPAWKVVDSARHLAPVTEEGIGPLAAFVDAVAESGPVARPVPVAARKVTTDGPDGLRRTADLYECADPDAPVLLLFHQARSSRGEYRLIGPRLAERGYHCLAIDQRSGGGWGGVPNETAQHAEAAGLDREYLDARADLEHAIGWARALGLEGPIGLVGSSYSASLALFVAADREEVQAVVAFSPGDYLPPRGSIVEAAARVDAPVLVVCPAAEEEHVRPVFEPIASENKRLFVQDKGVHGASTLDRSATRDEAWAALLAFLEEHLER